MTAIEALVVVVIIATVFGLTWVNAALCLGLVFIITSTLSVVFTVLNIISGVRHARWWN